MIRFYCGIGHTVWDKHEVRPGPYACISPVSGSTELTKRVNMARVPSDTFVIQDSGAFSDGPNDRLDYAEALDRQYAHAERYGYTDNISHVASYDVLIDEKWHEGQRSKKRWQEEEAWEAVNITVEAARYLDANRPVGKGLIQSLQGVSAQQYLQCAERVLEYYNPKTDIIGLGGWCIIGKQKKAMVPVFRQTIKLVIPYLARHGVERVHIWGVLYAPSLGELNWLCDQHQISVSTDSIGPAVRPIFGHWGYADWYKKIKPIPVKVRGIARANHVKQVRRWLDNFEQTQYYRPPASHLLNWDQYSDSQLAA